MFKGRRQFHKKKTFEGRPRSDVQPKHARHTESVPRPRHPGFKEAGRPEGHSGPVARERGRLPSSRGFCSWKGRVGFVLSEDPKAGDVLVQEPTLRLAMDGSYASE